MTSSRLETPLHTTGAHRAHQRAPLPRAQRSPVRYEPHLDGLFTYCLSVLCDHEAATDALGSVLAIAERQGSRCPAGEEERKSWLYALARWVCLRGLTEQKRGRQAHRRTAGSGRPDRRTPVQVGDIPPEQYLGTPPVAAGAEAGSGTPQGAATPGSLESPAVDARRRELAQLAWPEAAGTTPEQREALELAVRHGLTPRAVAAVLGLEPVTARDLLAAAACEVERTRAALAVVETGACATVARLTGGHRGLLSAVLRRELVRHVDDCPRCRRAAERAGAMGPWPGATVTPAALPVVEAPRPSVHLAMVRARRTRGGTPRFGRAGFPLDPKDHAARRDRLRARVVTTTVVATVVAAPVIALWAAYRSAPLTGEGNGGSTVTATELHEGSEQDGDRYEDYENAGNARPDVSGRFTDDAGRPDVSAEVVSAGGAEEGAGTLSVAARAVAGRTVITLTAAGGEPVAWSARTDAPWLRLSRTSGTLAPGRSVTVHVFVNRAAEPDGPWKARVVVGPSESAVAIGGYGATTPSSGVPTDRPDRPSSPDPTPRPTDPTPDPTPDPSTPTPGPTEPTEPGTTPPPTPSPTGPEPSTPPSSPGDATTDPGTRTPAG